MYRVPTITSAEITLNSSHRLVITLTGTLLFVSPGLAQQD